MKLVLEMPHEKYGSALFVREDLQCDSLLLSDTHNFELLKVKLDKLSVTSVYKPPTTDFVHITQGNDSLHRIIAGDFNSHHTAWGYTETNDDGYRVETWANTAGSHP